MNLPKSINRQLELDRRLHQNLAHWAERQHPPVSVRHELMRAVRQEASSQGHYTLRLPSDGFIETVYLGPVITFNHCFGMVFSLQARIRL